MRMNTTKPAARALAQVIAALLLTVLTTTSASALKGDCGQPSSTGPKPGAVDALAILKEAVGQTTTCDAKPCICDVSGNTFVQASDALITLKIAVGQAVPLNCKCPVPTTTTTSSTSTSTSTSTTSTTIPTALTWTQIQAVFATSCAGSGCHDGDNNSGNMKGIENKDKAYAELTGETLSCSPTTLEGKKRVVPGNPAQSFLMHKLDGTQDCEDQMPLVGDVLPQGFRDGVRLWIMEGAPNN